MNELAESAIEHELALVGADLEQKLSRAAELLRSCREDHVERDVAAFAHAEVTVDDPLQSRQVALEARAAAIPGRSAAEIGRASCRERV